MKIAIVLKSPKAKDFYSKVFDRHDLYFASQLDQESIEKIRDCEILVVTILNKVSENLITKLPKLSYVVTQSTGFDHIDVIACKKYDIQVSNVPSYGERSIAEFTVGLILNMAKNIHIAHQRTQSGNFFSDNLEGNDIEGKILGIVGLGKIGKETALLAKAMGMKILAFDFKQDLEFAKQHNVEFVEFNELLRRSDYVSLSVLLTEKTHHLINREALELMKKGAYLINISRGEVVDTQSLISALKNKKIAGAALDVLEGEKTLAKGNPNDLAVQLYNELLKYNILHTPHIASYSKEAWTRVRRVVASNVLNWIAGSPENLL